MLKNALIVKNNKLSTYANLSQINFHHYFCLAYNFFFNILNFYTKLIYKFKIIGMCYYKIIKLEKICIMRNVLPRKKIFLPKRFLSKVPKFESVESKCFLPFPKITLGSEILKYFLLKILENFTKKSFFKIKNRINSFWDIASWKNRADLITLIKIFFYKIKA